MSASSSSSSVSSASSSDQYVKSSSTTYRGMRLKPRGTVQPIRHPEIVCDARAEAQAMVHAHPQLLPCFGGTFEDTVQVPLSFLLEHPTKLLYQSRSCCAHLCIIKLCFAGTHRHCAQTLQTSVVKHSSCVHLLGLLLSLQKMRSEPDGRWQ